MNARVMGILLAGVAVQTSAQAPELRFVTQVFPPFVAAPEQGPAAGVMVDALTEACRRLGWHCEVKNMVWKRALLMIEQGQADGLLLAQDLPERRARMELSQPVFASSYGLFALRDANFSYHHPADLAGRQLAVYGPSLSQTACERLVRDVPGVTVNQEADADTVLRKLSAGRYGSQAVAFSNEDVARYWLARNGIHNVKAAGSVQPLAYLYGFTRTRVKPGMLAAFDHTLDAMCRDGSLKRIARDYDVKLAACR